MPAGYEDTGKTLSTGIQIYRENGTNNIAFVWEANINFYEKSGYLFYNLSSLKTIKFTNINTKDVTAMNNMFEGCSSLTALNLTKFNTAKVTTFEGIFSGCSSLQSLSLAFTTSKVTNMSSMFYNCNKLSSLNLSYFNTINVTNMSQMFRGCGSLTTLDLSNFETISARDMSEMFGGCSSLTSLNISNFDTSSVTNMSEMFASCSSLTSLNLSSFNTSSVTDMSGMFSDCSNLESLDLSTFDTQKVENMGSMFHSCGVKILDLSNFKVENVKQMWAMFKNCTSLVKINLTGFNPSSAQELTSMFKDCSKLSYIDLSSFVIGKSAQIEDMLVGCTNLKIIETPLYNVIKTDLPEGNAWFSENEQITTMPLTEGESKTISVGYVVTANTSIGKIAETEGWTVSANKLSATQPIVYSLLNNVITLDQLKTLPTAIQAGYIFNGWYTQADGGIKISVPMTISENSIIYAQWQTLDATFPTTWKDELQNTTYMTSGTTVDYKTITSIKFETTAPSGYSKIGTLSTGIEVYANGTDLAFVWGKTIYAPEDCDGLFSSLTSITEINFDNFDTSNATNMSYIFKGCRALTTLDVSNFNTSAVINMCGMFSNCVSLTTLDISNFNTSKVTSMDSMFFFCSALTTLNLNNFVTYCVTNMRFMFGNCSTLTALDLSNFDTYNVTKMDDMFYECRRLEYLDLSSFDMTNVTDATGFCLNCSTLKIVKTPQNTPNSLNIELPLNGNWYNNYNLLFKYMPLGQTTIAVGYLITVNANGGTIQETSGWTLTYHNGVAIGAQKTVRYALNNGVVELEKLTSLPQITRDNYVLNGMYTQTSGGEEISATAENPVLVNKDLSIYAQWTIIDATFPTSWKDELKNTNYTGMTTTIDPTTITSIKFETTAPIGYSKIGTLSTGLEVYANGTNIAFVCAGTIYAPQSCYNMFRDLSNVTEITFNNFDTSKVTIMYCMFWGCSSLTTLDVSNFNTSAVTDMSFMFMDCSSLTRLDLSNFNTSKVTDMGSMFSGCKGLTTLDASNFDTSKVTSMDSMLCGCKGLTTLDVSNFDTSKVTSMGSMFWGCSSLTTIDVSNFDISAVTNMSFMFRNCSSLTRLDLSNFNTSAVTSMDDMLKGCSSLKVIELPKTNSLAIELPTLTRGSWYDGNAKITTTPTTSGISRTIAVGYLVTANANGGAMAETEGWELSEDNLSATKLFKYAINNNVVELEELTTLPQVAKENYDFKGWYTQADGGDQISTPLTVNGDLEIYAQFEIKTFTYTFYDEDGTTVLKTDTINYGEVIIAPETPTKASDNTYTYAFAGWTPEFVEGTTITANVSYTATYSKDYINYTITFKNADGSVILTKTDYHYGDTVAQPAETPTKPADDENTYVFVGWTPDFVSTVKGNAEYTATFSSTTNSYTYTFYDEDGTTVLKTDTINYGEVIIAPENPTKESDNTYNYTFAGWTPEFVEGTTITTDVTYTATYSREYMTYTVTFKNADGLEISSKNDYHYGDTVEVPANPTKESDNTYTYTFAGWTPEVVTTVAGNAEYTAKFTSEYINYTITFKNADGSVILTKTDYHYGDTVAQPAETPTKPADDENTYVFVGWTPDFVSTVKGNAEYTATFSSTTKSYIYTFFDEDGTTVLKTDTINYGEVIIAPENPTKASDNTYTYTFTGWTPEFVEGTTITANVSYTATYSKDYINYTITFKNADGSIISSKNDYRYGDTVEVPAINPTKPADIQYTYTFAGWTPELSTTVAGNVEYTATFSSTTNSYTYTFYDEDGTTVIKTDTINYGEVIVAPENPTKASDNTYTYAFAGWTPEFVEGTTITANVSYRATYSSEYINYTITFKNEDGSIILTKADYHYGDTVAQPTETPTKSADAQYTYTFAGWTPELSTTVAGNVEYTATFTSTVNKYTITLKISNGTFKASEGWTISEDGKTATKVVDYGTTVLEDIPEIEIEKGQNFIGWYTEQEGGRRVTISEAISGNLTVYARYEQVAQKDNSTIVIVLIVIGSLVVIAIITGAVIYGIRKSKSKKRKVVLNNPNLLNVENERNEVFNKNIKKPVMQETTHQEVKTKSKKVERPKLDSNKDAK